MKKELLEFYGFTFSDGASLNVAADEHDDKNCDDFSSHEEVMEFWYTNGYSAENDPHDLDRDNDGLACEVSQSEYDDYVASQEAAGSNDEASGDQEEAVEEDEEGAALPDTASNGPLMMLFGAGIAGAGSLLLFRRKNQTAEQQ
ncbi:cell surface protein [Planococcus sp. MB-3u-03]|uniref:excalibur calcium-binding domain-containing protein n=1 Tax=Planococcus sp. MB-3u-03 TaxID=2058136 RepID=UPI000C32CD83|nr:excalibur calcium-binding domain-containing protein [Planococcus sp. MB-3u-03]AUD13182.1 cell surface protein [Planococcus sp. MB-3u-03]